MPPKAKPGQEKAPLTPIRNFMPQQATPVEVPAHLAFGGEDHDLGDGPTRIGTFAPQTPVVAGPPPN